MAGKDKYAKRMADHLGEAVDAACPITRTGGTMTQIGGTVGGVVGAGFGATARSAPSDVEIGQFGWLGVGPTRFTLTKASAMGKPTGEPLAQVDYTDVTAVSLTEGKITLRADLDLACQTAPAVRQARKHMMAITSVSERPVTEPGGTTGAVVFMRLLRSLVSRDGAYMSRGASSGAACA